MRLQHVVDLPPGRDLPFIVNGIIEIPKGRRSKFEFDKSTGLFRLDRYLFASSHYPGDYGFIPQTLAGDGDALDILIMVNEPTFTGCLIEARVLGLFCMQDSGRDDYKILAVPAVDPGFEEYHTMDDVPRSFLREVEHFFGTYKQLEGKNVQTRGWQPMESAHAEVLASVERYRARIAARTNS